MSVQRQVQRTYWSVEIERVPDYSQIFEHEVRIQVPYERANLVGSLTATGRHAPALDLDSFSQLELVMTSMATHYWRLSLATKPTHRQTAKRLERQMRRLGIIPIQDNMVMPDFNDPNLWHIVLNCPAQLVPSSTPGHHHLYLDVEMSWRRYRKLLRLLCGAGIIEHNFYKLACNRGQSFLRRPGVTKDNQAQIQNNITTMM